MQPTSRKLYPMTPAIQPARQPSPDRKPCIPARGDEENEVLLRFTHHHDLAYKTVERAVALEQQKAYASALKYYTAGLHELNAALRSPLPADDRYVFSAYLSFALLGTQPTAPAPPVPVAPPHLANPRPGPEEILAGLRAHGVDETMAQFVLDNTFQPSPAVAWDTVAGLDPIKRNLQESVVFPLLRPDLFTGLRAPPRGILLFGPSGTGKTLLVRAAAREARCAFFSISPCTLLSLHPDRRATFLRTLCVVAQTMAPSLVFWDDLDHNLFTGSGSSEQMQQYELRGELIASFERLMAARSSESTTASPLDHSKAALPPSRLPSTTNSSASLTSLPASTLTANSPDILVTSGLVVVMAATNQPERLDDRLRARFARRIYVPLPNLVTRYTLITHLLSGASSYTTTTPHHAYAGGSPPNSLKSATDHRYHQLSQRQIDHLVELADGYACSDILAVGKDAALVPIREITDPQQLLTLAADAIRSVKYEDWLAALGRRKPSVDPARHAFFKQWARLYASEVDS
ncbi:hypothetical protein IWQ60_007567 [Tieghemiomyces parasiticus]|uniref:microtubule-severing ATPase n=1 Tax=Tieghemiomyces parasiticus TaxID=78921 RepID=A0A9W8DTL9_9FUNG|nr:hypothetical protein IWQ60_007567 [Tieghemiomyces parasiticus]